MLAEIFIQNLAVIEQASIAFTSGLNIFTGETGAGKSIVVDSINAVLGQRMSRDIIRTGCEKALAMGVFTGLSKETQNILADLGYETEDGQLIIQRELHADGRSAARVCGRPVNLSVLKELCNDLVNIHGQHDSQTLLASDKHINILDGFGGYETVLEEYQHIFAELRSIVKEMEQLSANEMEKAQRADLLTYQIDEITAAELQPGEDDALEADVKLLRNYSGIAEHLAQALQYLSGNGESGGAVELLSAAGSSLSASASLNQELEALASGLQDSYYEVQATAARIGDFLDGFDFSPERLQAAEDRLDEIRRLKKKYGLTIGDVLAHLEQAKTELSQLEGSAERLQELGERRHELMQKAREQADKLSDCRKQAADRFAASVTGELKFLDMPNVVLKVSLTPCKMNRHGRETVEFLISTNPGEPPKPISKIASGGELSRIMLAIKNSLADKDSVPTLIFDEVDTGVSGRAAQKIGLKLKEVAQNKQVICVTHLAQIAALADTHFLTEKSAKEGRTFTEVHPLDLEGRKQEVARIMGTGQMTELLLQNAEELIKNGQQLTKQ